MVARALKPLQPYIQSGHPLNRGLLHAFLFNSGGIPFDLCNRLTPPISFPAATTWLAGRAGLALQTDKTNYALVKTGTVLATLPESTIATWFRVVSNGASPSGWFYCERASAGNDIFKIGFGNPSANKAAYVWRDDGGTLVNSGGSKTINDGWWHHICMTIIGTSLVGYIDGIRDIAGTVGTRTFTNAGLETRIGSDKADTAPTGVVATEDMRLWSRALTASDVWALYNTDYSEFRPARQFPAFDVPAAPSAVVPVLGGLTDRGIVGGRLAA